MRSNTYVRAVVAVICLALPLILAAPSMATSPTGGISFLDVTGGSTATVRTSVNPQGSQTSAHLEYGIASSAFCTSFGVDAGGKNFSNFQDVGSDADKHLPGHFRAERPVWRYGVLPPSSSQQRRGPGRHRLLRNLLRRDSRGVHRLRPVEQPTTVTRQGPGEIDPTARTRPSASVTTRAHRCSARTMARAAPPTRATRCSAAARTTAVST